MPGFDGTGPMGMGPMTGGGRGWCNPYGRMYGTGFARPWMYGGSPYASPYAYAPQTPYGYGGAMPWHPMGMMGMGMQGYAAPFAGVGWGRGMGMAWGRGGGMGRGGAWGRGRRRAMW